MLDTGLQFKDLFSSMFERGAEEDDEFEDEEDDS